MPESFTSPNPIPPRTSSHGGTNSVSSINTNWNTALKPVPEDEWIASASRKAGANTIPKTGHKRARSSIDNSAPDNTMWTAEREKIILGPYEYLLQQPGKDIRAQLIAAFNRLLQVPEHSLAIITKVVGMLHTSSLLVDDVEDSSVLRRGIPVAHNIFGTPQTINTANYVYFLALEEIQKLKNPTAIDVFTKELINLHRGQGMDLFWRDTLTCPTEAEYLEMVGNKTGGLFRLAVRLMQAESSAPIDCVPLVNVMGLTFQVADDYLNLSHQTYSKNKGLCEDLTEGKFSFPVIHSIRSQPDNLQLLNILKQKTKDDGVKRYAVKYMESTGSFAYTQKVVVQFRDRALALIGGLENAADEFLGSSQGQGQAAQEKRGDLIRSIIERIVEPVFKASENAP